MTVRQIYLIIGLAGIALLGIVGLQAWHISDAIRLSRENFQVSVNDALQEVANQLYRQQMRQSIFQVTRKFDLDLTGPNVADSQRVTVKNNARFWQWSSDQDTSVSVEADSTMIVVLDSKGQPDTMTLAPEKGDAVIYYRSESDPGRLENVRIEMKGNTQMLEVFSEAISGMAAFGPLESRISYDQVDSLLKAALLDQGINLNYQFIVTSGPFQRVAFRSPKVDIEAMANSPYRVRLLSQFDLGDGGVLYVNFPNPSLHTFKSIWLQVAGSALFTTIVLVSFVLTIRIIFRQKKLSEMKNDFINNMTHELKTPIATISLASDALRKTGADPGSSGRYLDIIKEENARMNRQVERVLQAARWDRGETNLNFEMVDLHDLVEVAAAGIELQIADRGGELHYDLRATNPELNADREHLIHVLTNLLDNANKYSPESPKVTLRTRQEGDDLVLEVQDQGTGIAKADQPRVFDRFYRVTTGDLHEVKGFGLGLSYVKEVVEAHGGTVSVESAPNQGSTFILRLPKNPPNHD